MRLYLLCFILLFQSKESTSETVGHNTASQSIDELSNVISNKTQSVEEVKNDSIKSGEYVRSEANVNFGSNKSLEMSAIKTRPIVDFTTGIDTIPNHFFLKNIKKRQKKASKRIIPKAKAAVNRIPDNRKLQSRRKGWQNRKLPLWYNPAFDGKKPEYRRKTDRNNRKWPNSKNSRTRKSNLICLRYPNLKRCHYMRKVLAQPSRKKQKLLKVSPVVSENQKPRMIRSLSGSSYDEEESTVDKGQAAEYDSMYEDYEDYEIYAYTSMTQPTTTRPMTLFGVELYDERESAKQDDEYLLFGNPPSGEISGEEDIDIIDPSDLHSNEPSRIVSIERQKQLADEQTAAPGLEVPEYFEYYDGYDYTYDNEQFDRTVLDKTQSKPEESMEEVYFMETTPPTRSPMERTSLKVKNTGEPLSESTKLKRVLKSRVNRTNSKGQRRSKTMSTTTTNSLPTAIPRDTYYDSNYDDQMYEDDYYDDSMDPLIDTDFLNFTEHAKLNKTYQKKDNSSHSTASPDLTIVSTSVTETLQESSTTVPPKTHTSASVPRRMTATKPPPKPPIKPVPKSQHFGQWKKRPVYSSYYDDLDGLNYNWNYDNDDAISDYDDYVYENNETSNLDVEWFSKLDDNNETLADILRGVELLEDPETDLQSTIDEGDRETSDEMNSSNAHVLVRRPFRRVNKQVCYLTGGVATEMFLRVDASPRSVRHFQDLTCTHLVIGMGRVVDNTLRLPSWTQNKQRRDIKKIIALIKRANIDLKILLAVGESKECPSYVFKFWKDTDPRQSFIEAAIELLREVDLDGLEYHFIRFDMADEEFRILAELVRETYILFKSNAISLRQSKLTVSLAVPKYLRKKLTNKASEYNLRDLYKYLDFSNLVSTDLHDGNDIKGHDPPFLSNMKTANTMAMHLIGQSIDSYRSLKMLPVNSKGRGRVPPFRPPCPAARQPGLIAFNQIFQFIGQPPPMKQNDKPVSSYFTDGRTWMSFESLMEKFQNPINNSTNEGYTIWGITSVKDDGENDVPPSLPPIFGNYTQWRVSKVNNTES